MSPSDPTQLQQTLKALEADFEQALQALRSSKEIEALRAKYLGRKSALADYLKRLPEVPQDQRGIAGKALNTLKASFEARLAERQREVQAQPVASVLDVTLPGRTVPHGRLHPVTHTLSAIINLFVPMGFEVVEGPELEYERYNFDALNIPSDHPSRESFDTFFIDAPSPQPQKGRLLLRSHTSPVQIRVMEKRKPPLRILVPGTVYRPDPLDASHSFMFHQVEGLFIDDRTSFADLKGTLQQFVERFFGRSTKVRFRPHFFPFTEPSAEVDIACTSCQGRGCSTCGRKGWLEIMGCGMVHPNVFKAVGYDPAKVQGFAFGMGVERIAMLKYGITDIRLFFENDLRFLEQF